MTFFPKKQTLPVMFFELLFVMIIAMYFLNCEEKNVAEATDGVLAGAIPTENQRSFAG